jgi:preprotein translocase subunit SecG
VLITILTIALFIVCLALIGLILIQQAKGGGLAGVFGGGGMEQAFGTRATTLAQKATAVLGVLFLVLTIVLGLMISRRGTTRVPSTPVETESPAEPALPAETE